jgi:LacI family transcriptional regulator
MASSPASNLIGCLCDTQMVGSGFFGMLQVGLMAGCQKWDLALVVRSFDLTDPGLGGRVRDLLARTNLRGVVLPEPACEVPAMLEVVTESGLPLVRIAPHSEAGNTFDICVDNEAAGYDVTRHLIGLGHRRIAFIEGPPDHGDAKDRRKGFLRAMAEAGLEADPAMLLPGGFDFAQGLAAAERLLALNPTPTAVFCCNDEVAAAVLATTNRLGVKVPDEMSLAGFDDSPLARSVWPQLTTCRQKMELTGYMAVDFIVDPPVGPEARRRPQMHELVIRHSTARPRVA